MFYTVYKTTNNITGAEYIGVHKTTYPNDSYLGSGVVLTRAIKKYGRENFTKIILASFDNEEDMYTMESVLVNESTLPSLMNLVPGGCPIDGVNRTGRNMYPGHADQWREYQKLGQAAAMAKRNDPAFRERWSELQAERAAGNQNWLGKTHSEETRAKIGAQNSVKQAGERNSQFGTCWIIDPVSTRAMKVRKDELSEWIDKGWTRGRTLK